MSIGCTNHGCWIEKPKGMGTNGMCHCLEALGNEKARAVMAQIARLRRIEKGPAYADMPLCASPLTYDEAMKIEAHLEPLLRYLGSPGDWGYETKLGCLVMTLQGLRSAVRRRPLLRPIPYSVRGMRTFLTLKDTPNPGYISPWSGSSANRSMHALMDFSLRGNFLTTSLSWELNDRL